METRSIKLIYLVVFCLLLVIPGQGQILLHPAGFQQNTDDPVQSSRQVADSGYMILTYDDGIAENYCAWQLAGNMMAVKFDLQPYTASVIGARVYVGDGSYLSGGNMLNQPFRVSVYDSDGENGLPGTLVDSVSAIVKNYGWITVTGLWATLSHEFYIVITQLSDAPDCIAIGVDETQTKANCSYSRNIVWGNPWVLSPYQDLMINALVSTNVGFEEFQSSAAANIYPNPASVFITIELNSPFDFLEVYSGTGNKLKELKVEGKSNLTIDISQWKSGLYYLRLLSGNRQTENEKFIKM